jgi:hypothetical protein
MGWGWGVISSIDAAASPGAAAASIDVGEGAGVKRLEGPNK